MVFKTMRLTQGLHIDKAEKGPELMISGTLQSTAERNVLAVFLSLWTRKKNQPERKNDFGS